jgi:hypothetical protein
MAEVGQEDQFPSPSLSGRCRLDEATFAGMSGKEEDAPITATQYTDTPRDYGGSESTLSSC